MRTVLRGSVTGFQDLRGFSPEKVFGTSSTSILAHHVNASSKKWGLDMETRYQVMSPTQRTHMTIMAGAVTH